MTFTTRRLREETALRKSKTARLAPFFARGGRFLGGWYGRWKKRKKEEKDDQKRTTILKRVMVILLSIFLGLLLLSGTVKALVILRILTPSTIFSTAGAELPADENGFTNFLLVGGGDKTHDGVDLLDTIMIASLDPKKTKSVVLLSLPRDLYALKTEKMGKGRINALYRDYKGYLRAEGMTEADASQEALKELGKELGSQLGIQIHHILKVDFIAFVQAVDALGGVDIEVPYDIVDTQYPGQNYSYQTFEIHAGPQHLDGETALKYARSRHTTSDFDRSARQQQLLRALGEQAKASGIAKSPGKLTNLLQILSEHVETTMSFREILGAAGIAQKLDRENVVSMHLNNQTGEEGGPPAPGGFLYNPPRDQFQGASILLPNSIPSYPVTWKQLQTFVRMLIIHRSLYLAHPNLHILNAGARTGLGRALGAELIRYGFPVAAIENATVDGKPPKEKRPQSLVIAKTEADEAIAEFFGALLGLPVQTAYRGKNLEDTSGLPTDIPAEKLGQVNIVLGEDFSYEPFQDLLPPVNE